MRWFNADGDWAVPFAGLIGCCLIVGVAIYAIDSVWSDRTDDYLGLRGTYPPLRFFEYEPTGETVRLLKVNIHNHNTRGQGCKILFEDGIRAYVDCEHLSLELDGG